MIRPGILWSIVFGAALVCGSTARAAFTITVQQSGPNVVASGIGTLKTTGESTNVNGSSVTAQINSGTATTTLAGLNLTPGQYAYSYGTSSNADTFTVNIVAVPEPASLCLVGVPAAFLLARRGRSFRR